MLVHLVGEPERLAPSPGAGAHESISPRAGRRAPGSTTRTCAPHVSALPGGHERLTGERADVGAVVRGIEMDPAHVLVRELARLFDARPARHDAQHAATGRHEHAIIVALRAGDEDADVRVDILNPG